MFVVYPTRRYDFVWTLETKELDFSYSERNFAYEFTANNDYFACKQKLLLYCYIIPGSCFPFCLLVFPLLHWSIPGFKIRMYFFKTKNSGRILKAFCVVWTSVTFSSTRMYFAWRSYTLIHLFVLFFSITSQKEKICVKKKQTILGQAAWFFFSYFISDGHKIFKRLNIYKSGITMNISNT